MARNHYEIVDKTTQTVIKTACAANVAHGALWHDAETRDSRNMTIDGNTPLAVWKEAACMENWRKVQVAPVVALLDLGEPDGLTRHPTGSYQLVEVVDDPINGRSLITHGKVSDGDYKVIQPSEFAEWMAKTTDKIAATGQFAELSILMRLEAETGSHLVGNILLGELDFGAGDKGKYYLAASTGYNVVPTELFCTSYRSACENMFAAGKNDALRSGRVVNFSVRNHKATRLLDLDDMVIGAVDTYATWSREFAERQKRLKMVSMPSSPATWQALKLAALESGALKPTKDKDGSIPLTDDLVQAIRAGGKDAVSFNESFGSLGSKLIDHVIARQSLEASIGLEDCKDTAFGWAQGINSFATRRGEDGRGAFSEMARVFERNALATLT